ncbi:hypothetical protein V6N11_070073 [Hibiscus sabdariffa]|uniref:RNase H type-1 domain-containing protein n=1 Tax=Hibiscus sabdariffa TaxID=183260 RepID=A0ABR2QE17_9ROSI
MDIRCSSRKFTCPSLESNTIRRMTHGWVNQSEHRPWKFWEMFSETDLVCLDAGNVCFVHVFQEANGMADALAKEEVDRMSLVEIV